MTEKKLQDEEKVPPINGIKGTTPKFKSGETMPVKLLSCVLSFSVLCISTWFTWSFSFYKIVCLLGYMAIKKWFFHMWRHSVMLLCSAHEAHEQSRPFIQEGPVIIVDGSTPEHSPELKEDEPTDKYVIVPVPCRRAPYRPYRPYRLTFLYLLNTACSFCRKCF